jgi:L-ascorbate metabolism protein UlaG (beta-lactamase superfamily)
MKRYIFSVLFTGAFMMGCAQNTENIKKDLKPHYDDGKFKNHELEYSSNFSDFASNIYTFLTDKTENKIASKDDIPVVKLKKEDLLQMPNNSMLRIAHSTLLLKIDGRFILTDPVFSETITPFGIFAPKRFHELPITIEELPFIDIVVISHNHYDHLDEPSIKKLKDKVGHFYTTLGIKQKLLDLGVDTMKVCELDWWQSCVNETIRLRATPAQHFSGRSLFDRDKTLWSSWVITSSNTNIFFSGDTGYFNTFKEIGEKYGPFDITFLEAGAYNERWKEIHMMPKETVQAHLDLKGKILFPIHNSSFKLSLHAWNEPLEKVVDEANKKDIQITHPKFGEIISIEKFQNTKKWW